MPIIIVLLLTAACTRVPWPAPPLGFGGSGSLALTAFAFLLPIGAAIVLSRWVTATLRHDPDERPEIARRYAILRRWIGYGNLAIAMLAIAGLGWGWTVWHRAVWPIGPDGPLVLAPLAELLVPAPYLLVVFTIWAIHYDSERALHAAHRFSDVPFWSRWGHFAFQFRPFAFMVLLPLTLFATGQTFVRFAPELAADWQTQLAGTLVMPLLFAGMPLLIKPALGLHALPAGSLRDRFEAISRTMNFRYCDLLVWPTRDQMVNALVIGIVPRARYVVFTDRLLTALDADELDAVFGHEIGHAKHSHMPYYLAFFVLSVFAITGLTTLASTAAIGHGWIEAAAWNDWADLPLLAILMAYLFVSFGYISRQCERQADLFGCRVASGGTAIDPRGIDAMVRALGRVADLGGLDNSGTGARPSLLRRILALFRSWQHGSIAERIRYLQSLIDQPEREIQFQRRLFWVKSAILALLFAGNIVIGSIIGWAELVKSI